MNKLILAAATALSMAALPSAASAFPGWSPDGDHALHASAYEHSAADQQARIDALDSEQQAMYFGWDAALRGYYWSLDEKQQDAWWYLTDEQRIAMFQLQGEGARAKTWNAITAKLDAEELDGRALAAAGTPGMEKGMNTGMAFVSNPVVQQVAFSGSRFYHICTDDYDDHCINPWAAGRRGPGVDRPLDYWPGESATEMALGG